MTTLVTGASGFLGGRLTQILCERGERVRILARPTSQLAHLKGLALEVAEGDLEDADSLAAATRGVRTIFHCAALSVDWAPWERFEAVNVRGVQRLLDAATVAGTVERFVHVSTTDVYGYPRVPCDEDAPVGDARLPYSRSKGLGDAAARAHHARTGLPVTVVRPVNLYGPRSKDFVVEIANLLVQGQMMLVAGGRARAGLLYVDNAVDGLLAAARAPGAVGRAYNLRDGTDETWRDYVGALAAGLGTKLPWLNLPAAVARAIGAGLEGVHGLFRMQRRPLLTRHAVHLMARDQGFPIDRAIQELGFRAQIGFAEGMRRTLAWLDQPDGRAAVPRKAPAAAPRLVEEE
jgi:oxidoreductase